MIAAALTFALATAAPSGQIWQEKPKSSPALVALPDLRPLVKEALPAVVNISVEQRVRLSRGRQGQQPFGGFGGDPDEFFERFFGQRMPREYKNKGIGTGFVISKDGYVLTNNHVVENADSIKVKFQDGAGEELSAKIVGTDPRTDVALIKIEAKREFAVLPLGDSEALQVGEWVVAIGNPFGLAHSVSTGIVSAKDRRDIEPGGRAGLYDFIQTDASINPGNSGGPLINLRGEVVGINAAVNAAGQGLGFAIPINLVKSEIMDLKDKGRVSRSWLGVKIQAMTAALAKSYGLERPQGAIVNEVVERGPAEKAGVQAGDVVLEFDGKPIRDHSDLPLLAAQAGVNRTVTVVVLRDGKKRDIKVQLGEVPSGDEVALGGGMQPGEDDAEKGSGTLGLKISDMTQELRERFNVKEKQGVVVVDLDPAGPAYEAGLRPGDVIAKLNQQTVTTAKELSRTFRALKSGEVMRLLVRRGAGSLFIALPKP